jgi:hypothetical protein
MSASSLGIKGGNGKSPLKKWRFNWKMHENEL